MSIDRVLRYNMHNAAMLDIDEITPETTEVDKQIVIFDCRHHFLDLNNTPLPYARNSHSNIALIDPLPGNRNNAYKTGFADFLSWPVLAPELYARLLAQSFVLSVNGPKYRYSRVTLVERCCTYLAEHISQSFSVETLAQIFNTNHNTLTTVFKREMDLPPVAWQRMMRLEGAARQLRLTDSSITEVAADFGYALPGNFATAFRRHFGVTPHEYRKNERRKS